MATYTVYIAFTGGKGSSVSFRYPTTTSTAGTGHTSSNPLELNAGDNVKFVEVSGSLGGGTISGLDIFTDNSNFSYSGGDGTGEIADRTVDTGTTPSSVDTITATTGVGSNTDTFYFKRVTASIVAPTDITFGADPGTYDDQVSITATATGGTGGTMKVSEDGSTWVANGSSFTFTRGIPKTIYARTEGTGSNSGSITRSNTVGYIAPDLVVTVSRSPSGNLAYDYTGDVTVTISGGTANNRYRVLRTTGGNSGKGNTGILTGTSGTVGLHNADADDLPSAGNTVDYIIQGRVDTSQGGNNTYANTNASFSISRDQAPAVVAPVINNVTDNNASAANVTATVNLSSNGSGGTLKYAQSTANSVPASGWQTGNTFSHPRGTTRYYWASQDEDTSGTFDDSGAIDVGYLAPDTNVSISNNALTIGPSDTSDSVVVSGTTSGETYVVTIDNGTPSTASYRLGEAVATGSSTTINFSGHFPSEGNTYTYDIHAQRPTSTGGDGSSYTKASGVEFTVTRERAAITLGYGILLLDTDGTTSIISPDTRFFVKLTDEQSFSLAAGASDNILLDMTGLTTSNSTVIVLQLLYPTTFVAAPTVTRITSGASEGFQLTNPNSSTITFRAFAARF